MKTITAKDLREQAEILLEEGEGSAEEVASTLAGWAAELDTPTPEPAESPIIVPFSSATTETAPTPAEEKPAPIVVPEPSNTPETVDVSRETSEPAPEPKPAAVVPPFTIAEPVGSPKPPTKP